MPEDPKLPEAAVPRKGPLSEEEGGSGTESEDDRQSV